MACGAASAVLATLDALALVPELPLLEIVSSVHIICDLPLDDLGCLAESIAIVDNFRQSHMAASNCAKRNLGFLSRLKSRSPARTFDDCYAEIISLYTRAPRLTILDCLEHRFRAEAPAQFDAADHRCWFLSVGKDPWARLEYRGW